MENRAVWENNLRVLWKHIPALAENLSRGQSAHENLSRADSADTNLANAQCANGGEDRVAVVSSSGGDPALTVNGVHIHSLRGPRREAERLAREIPPGTGPVIILGFGLGYAAEAAAERFPGRPLLVVERKKSVFAAALECRDLSALLERKNIVIVLGGSAGAALSALRLFPGKPELLKNRPLVELDADWYGEAERQIASFAAKDEVNLATLRRFGKRWMRNLGANMTAIRDCPGIAALSGILPRDIPVLLVAAGPSLDGIAPLLPRLRERALIVAVDTALRLLLREGTGADFVLVVDPQFWNARHLDRAAARRTCLVAESAVYPSVLRHEAARIWLCGSLFPLGKFMEDRVDPKGSLGAGGSVATTAWDFARLLGASSIWIAGLDLSFPDLKTHFRGAAFEERAHGESTRFFPAEVRSMHALRGGGPYYAPAADGGRVLTDRRLSLYAAWFENRFRHYPEIRNRGLYTGTDAARGLAIAGLEPGEAGELLALPPRRQEIDAVLRDAFAAAEARFHAPEAQSLRARRYGEARRVLLDGLADIAEIAGRAAGAAGRARETARRRSGGAEIRAVLTALEEANARISASAVHDVAGFLFPPLAELEKDLTAAPGAELERHLELSAKLYAALAEASRYQLEKLSR
ncbi:MAG: DUF115 domain-containing protein [Spirochaetaceae bacterium]|jgi:hypothetical protein|nr:DUF115 domain-containing protein [Spirochaetaceae bacterium]